MTRLSQADRDHFRHLMQDVRARATASRAGDIVGQMLASQGHTLSPALHTALEAVAARDAMGPRVGTYPPDFCLKRLGTENRLRLSSFRGQREEREAVATTCSLDLHLSMPVLVEAMDNVIDEAYGAAPERLYLVGVDGRVAYHGGAGPQFFDLEAWEKAIAASVHALGTP